MRTNFPAGRFRRQFSNFGWSCWLWGLQDHKFWHLEQSCQWHTGFSVWPQLDPFSSNISKFSSNVKKGQHFLLNSQHFLNTYFTLCRIFWTTFHYFPTPNMGTIKKGLKLKLFSKLNKNTFLIILYTLLDDFPKMSKKVVKTKVHIFKKIIFILCDIILKTFSPFSDTPEMFWGPWV